MDYRIARNANILLGIAALGLGAYAYKESGIVRVFEETYLAIIAFYVLEALVFSIWFSKKSKQAWESIWRFLGAIVLGTIGGILIWSTVDIQDNYFPCNFGIVCQKFEFKIASASLTICNAIFYFLATPKAPSQVGAIVHSPQGPPGYPPQYEQSTIYVIPSTHLQSSQEEYEMSSRYLPVYPTAAPSYQVSTISNEPNPNSVWVKRQVVYRS